MEESPQNIHRYHQSPSMQQSLFPQHFDLKEEFLQCECSRCLYQCVPNKEWLLTVEHLHFPYAKNCVKGNNFATAAMLFARTTSIALFDANYFDLHTAWMMRYG